MQDPFGRDSPAPASKTGSTTRTPDGFFKNVLAKSQAKPVVPPGNALLAKYQAATKRQDAGLNPSVTPGEIARGILHGLMPKPIVATDAQGVVHSGQAGTVFSPLTMGLQMLQQAPALVKNAQDVGTRLAHPDSGVKQPSTLDILMSGVLGFPRAGVKFEGPAGVARSVINKTGGRTAAEAATHIEEARAFWKAKMPTPPLEAPAVKPGEVTAQTGGDVGGKVRAAFTTGEQTVAEARKATAGLQSVERGKRFAAGEAARAKAGGGTPGQIASLRAQQGELPYTRHPGLAGETSAVVETMIHHVENLPTLQEGQKLNTIESLRNWWQNGKPPTEGEQVLLEHAFGKNVAEAIAKDTGFRARLASAYAKAGSIGQEALLVPRALKATGDISGMFRQDLLFAISHPAEFAKLVPSMAKSTLNEGHFQGAQDKILTDHNFPIHWAAKVPYTDIGKSGAEGVGSLAAREEQFASNLAEKMTLRNLPGLEGLGKLGTGPGDIVRASDRAYLGILNPSRQAQANRLIQKAALNGEDLTDPKVVKAIGSATGALTGRGTLGPWLEKHAVSLNALLFSPRFAASRFNLIGFGGKSIGGIPGSIPGSYYANLYRASPTAAKEVFTSMRNLAVVAASVLYAAHKAGALVSLDPTNANFLKIRVGNTRVDILAGLQAPVRMMAQEILQKETSSQTGKVTHLGGSSYNALGRLDPAWKFLSAKASPVPSLALQQAGLSQQMQKQTPGSIAQNLLEPLSVQDALTQYQATNSIPAGALALLLSGTGLGIQNYKSPQPKSKTSDPYGRDGGTAPSSGKSSPDPYGR